MGSVILLELETTSEVGLEVSFRQGQADPRVLRSDSSTGHSLVLWGLKPEQVVDVDLALIADQEIVEQVSLQATPKGLGTNLPEFTLSADSQVQDSGFLLASVLGVHSGVAVVDSEGELTWWYPESDEEMLVSQAHLSVDGRTILYSSYDMSMENAGLEDRAWIHRVGLDGEPVESIEVAGMSHDFVELSDGSIAYISGDWEEVNGFSVRGNQLMERDPEGNTRQVFSVWDYLEFDIEVQELAPDWTHANALDYVPDLDAFLLGIRDLNTIVLIDRESGEPRWFLGGETSDFDWVGSGRQTQGQHQFQWLGDGLLVFDNRSREDQGSRVVELGLDTDTMEARQRWELDPDTGLYCYALGDVTRLDSGLTQVTWSVLGAVEHVDQEGEIHWQVQTGLGTALGYTGWLTDIDRGAVQSPD